MEDILKAEATRTAEQIKGKRNLQQLDSAIIVLRTVIGALVAEGLVTPADGKQMLEQDNADFRMKLAKTITPFITAANNAQNVYMVKHSLMESNKAEKASEYAA